MAEARPLLQVLLGSLVGLGLLGGWWVQGGQARRERMLDHIAVAEQARTFPPRARERTLEARLHHGLAQASWLVTHRLARLQGCGSLLGLGLLLGAAEGWAWQRRDRWGGMRLASWTGGLVSLACGPGLVGLLVLLPVPWSLAVVGSLGTGWALLSSGALLAGRPHVR